MNHDSEQIVNHYRALLSLHGDSAEAAQWADRVTQERRFAELARIADLSNASILDFGCGTGSFATWLEQRGISVQYTGVDLLPEFFDIAKKKHPQHRFGELSRFQSETFDYCIVSGVFNNVMKDNRQFYRDVLRDLYSRCRKGVAFNMMSTFVDYQDPNLFYEDPGEAIRFVKTELSPFVVLRHDYEVKPGIVPFEFAMYVYRHPSS